MVVPYTIFGELQQPQKKFILVDKKEGSGLLMLGHSFSWNQE